MIPEKISLQKWVEQEAERYGESHDGHQLAKEVIDGFHGKTPVVLRQALEKWAAQDARHGGEAMFRKVLEELRDSDRMTAKELGPYGRMVADWLERRFYGK